MVEADEGMVAADDERCSDIGRDALRAGGNAVDASVATAFCLGVVNPMASGIGGGAFMLLRLTNGTSFAYDMRETAPAAAHEVSLITSTYTFLILAVSSTTLSPGSARPAKASSISVVLVLLK
jgi:gamma-glutamyltranspeptidase